MKIYTNENNSSTLKLLIAANLAGKKVDVKSATYADCIFDGPRALPLFEVDEQLTFFSSNAAVQYLLPIVDLSENGQCQQMLEWEATRLQPTVQSVLSAKTIASDLKQILSSLINDIDGGLAKKNFVLGDKLSAADVAIWSTVYFLFNKPEFKAMFLSEAKNVTRWFEEISLAKAVQDAVKTWGGSVNGPFGQTCALGIPQAASLLSPGSPDEPTRPGPSSDEIAAALESWTNGHKAMPKRIQPDKVILPVKGRKNVLITSALPYVNNVPHLGNIIGCVLSADMFARYCRLCNYNTLYVSGTDEYGTATETKALEEGVTPRQICDKYFAIHNDVYRWFNIGFDHFGRTSTPEQTKITQDMFLKLQENGFISSQSVDQLLCQKCNRFLADRFVEGTCHHPGCLYESARGDQCDKCGRLVNAVELIQPRCKVCGESPVIKASEQLFLELGQLEPSLRTWASTRESLWSPPARAVSRAWLREGLRPRAITRDLTWGVAVPAPGFTSKVFYVWFDAPMGYLSITECATKQYEKWWKPDKEYDVTLYQFMAKDNVPFHAVMFPATLLGVNQGHVLVSRIFATEYLNYEEGKFSKSRGVGVFGTDAQDTGIPADVWRFYLASIRPETSDSSFSWTELGTRNNSELLNNIGNFCHRSLSFCASSFAKKVPAVQPAPGDLAIMALVNREVHAYVQNMEKGRLREALRNVLAISKLGNQHMQAEQPWALLKGSEDDKKRGATAVGLCCQLAALLCALLAPYMPAACRTLCQQLNLKFEDLALNPENPSLVQYLPPNHTIGVPSPIFTKLEATTLDQLREKYAGTQADRKNGEAKGKASVDDGAVSEIEAAITKQGEVVRKLKASTKDKSVWQPEVEKLLKLKKQLTEAQAMTAPPTSGQSVESLEKAISEQGEVVRKLKALTKDKSVWQPEVEKLLKLKKQLSEAQATTAPPTSGQSVESLEKAISEQGEKVRKLKASTKDKSVWQPEVNVLLDLKKQLTSLQLNK